MTDKVTAALESSRCVEQMIDHLLLFLVIDTANCEMFVTLKVGDLEYSYRLHED
jgi:hypothetical protein